MSSSLNIELASKVASPLLFAEAASRGQWKRAPHLERLSWAILDTIRGIGGCRRLIVSMPPRHGKSELCSKYLPAWHMGVFPDRRVILSSYEATFAEEWGRKSRAVFQDVGQEWFGYQLADSPASANHWAIKGQAGSMQTVGVGGPLTGKGAHLLLVDDPHKNAEEAASQTIRRKIWDWWQSTAYTRLEPDGAVILVQTRWNRDDLAGRLIAEMNNGGEKWRVVNLPAIGNDGAALWPERFSVADLQRIKQSIGSYFWQALYQQDPQPAEGRIVKAEWLRYFTLSGDYYQVRDNRSQITQVVPFDRCLRVIIADCAASSADVAQERRTNQPSRSVISTFDWDSNTGFLFWRRADCGFWSFNELLANAQTAIRRDSPAWFGAEDEKTGRALLGMLRGYNVRPISHENKDKLTRFHASQVQLEQGNIFMPAQQTAWRDLAIEQLLAWTGHPDEPFDFGDTLAYAVKKCNRENTSPIVWGTAMVRG